MNYLRPFWLLFLVVLVSIVAASPVQSENIKPEILRVLETGDTARAITFLNKQISLDPTFHLNYYTLGEIYRKQENLSLAIEQFSLALDKKSKHYESLYSQAICQLNLGQLDEAEKGMQKGLAKAKKMKTIFQNGYGLVLMGREQYNESLNYLLQAVNADSMNAEYHINVGDAYYYMEVPFSALIEYEKALALDTAGTEVYFHWAEACLETKDFKCALEKLRIVLVKDSTYVPAWRRAGEIYFKAAMSARTRKDREARFKDAIGAYRKYLSLSMVQPDSQSVRVFFELGMSYASINGFESAVEEFEKVLLIPFEPRDIYFYYGKSLTRNRDYPSHYIKGSEMLKKHLDWVAEQDETYATRIKDWEIYQLLGDCYFYRKSKDFYTAVRNYKKSLEFRPEQKRLIQNIAIGLDRQHNYREALSYYSQRIEMGIDSSSSRYYRNAAYCALSIANADTDDEELEDELEEDADDSDGGEESNELVDDADVDYFQLGADYLEKYLEYSPDDEKVIRQLATTYYHNINNCENGVKWYGRLSEVDPSNCEANKWLGFAYFGGLCTKNYGKALGYLKKANTCLTTAGETDLDIMIWVAQAHHLRAVATKDVKASKKDYKAAYDWYSKVVKVDATHAEAKKGVEQTIYEF